jgi:threonine aldolase
MKKTFASDNYSGVHPEVMEALLRANTAHAGSYGADEYTERAIAKFRNTWVTTLKFSSPTTARAPMF